MQIGSAIGGALQSINRSAQSLNANAQQVQQEGISAEAVVDSKVQENSIKANLASIGTILETEGSILNILA